MPAEDPSHRVLAVDSPAAGTRLDRFLADALPDLSRSRLQQLIRDGSVHLNGAATRPAARLSAGDRVMVALPPPDRPYIPQPDAGLPLKTLHVDEALIVVDKPPGQVVHPGAGHESDTLVNALVARYPALVERFGGRRPGIVHRLDRDTSGVLVVARTPEAAVSLRRQFKARSVEKVYLALAKGKVSPPEGLIDAPVGRDPAHRKRMAAVPDGRPAQTVYRMLEHAGRYSWLEVRPRTGRTHQVRVHLAAIGHPLAGDRVYGRSDEHIDRVALHAWQLGFDHPVTGEWVRYLAPLPEDLGAALAEIGIGPPDEGGFD
jgi:23S rRNA pseudouridine1911/1915/1917 synthase